MSVYETRAVLFLDILGFRGLIASRKEKQVLEALTMSSISPVPPGASIDPKIDFKITAFSDCIVCSARILAKGNLMPAAYVSAYAGRLALEMLSRGILSRGAITVGKLYHKEQTVFGPALIEAYELENNFALYPRIIVPPKVMGGINITLAVRVSADWWLSHHPFREDFDGVHHLDIFGPFFISSRPPLLKPKRAKSLKALGPATTRVVNQLCRTRYNDPRVSTKYAWMRSYLDDCCIRFGWGPAHYKRNSLDKHRGSGLVGLSDSETIGELMLSLVPRTKA